MKTMQHLCVVVFLLLLISTIATAQTTGDYRSAVNGGSWGTIGTWEMYDGATWVIPLSKPGSSNNVTIRNGYDVYLDGTNACKNLTIETGATLKANASLPGSTRNMRIAGTTVTVDGTFGDPVAPGDIISMEIYVSSATITISGTGTFAPAQFRVNSSYSGNTIIFNMDTKFMYAGSGGTGGSGLHMNNSSNNIITVNAGKTLTFVNYSYIATGSSVSSAAPVNVTFNIYGTVDLSGSSSQLGLKVTSGNTAAFNIYTGGSVTVGKDIKTSTVSDGGTTSMLVDGALAANGPVDFSNPSFVVTGIGTFTLGSGASLSIGHAEGITSSGSTGQIRTNSRSFSSGADYGYVGTAAQVTGTGLPSSVNGLTIDNSNGVTLSSSTSVDGTLSFTSGVVTTGSNTLAISSTGSTSGSGGWVYGNFKKYVGTGTAIARTFEIGNSSNYTPVDVTFDNVSNGGDLTAYTTDGDHPQNASSNIDASKSVNRYYTLTNSGISFDEYDAVFNFVSGDVDGGADPNNFIAQKYDGANWSDLTEGTKTSTSTQIINATGFSDFAIGEALPAPIAELSGSSISFGSVVVGNSSTDSVFLRNIGTANLHVDSIVSDNGDFSAVSASSDIAAGDSAKITVTFSPSGLGAASANINIYHNAASSPDLLTASGTGIPTPPIVSNGTGGGDWNTGSTWIGSVVPISTDNVQIQGGDSVYLTAAGSCDNLTLDAGAVLALNASSLTVPGSSWSFDQTSTVYYNNTTTIQSAPTYGNLVYSAGNGGPNGNLTVNGNLTITTATLRGISATSGTVVHNVAGDVTVGPGTSARISAVNNGSATTASCTWNIGGNISLTSNASGNRLIVYESAGPHSGDAIYNIDGDLEIGTGSQVQFRSSTSGTASDTGHINVKENLTNNGNITCPSGATAGLLVINLNGTSAQQYTGNFPSFSSAACELIIDNAAGVTLGSAATINQRVTLSLTNGLLVTTSSNLLTLSANGTINGGSAASFISGPLAIEMPTGSTTRDFPIGDASEYTPVNVAFGNVTTGNTLTATSVAGDHPEIGSSGIFASKSLNRYWTLVDGGLAFDTYDATFNFVSGDVDAEAVPANFIAQKYDGATWTDLTEGTMTGTSSQITGATSFSDFAFGERGPITILSNGTGGGDWANTATWQGAVVPLSIDSVVILSTDSVYVLGATTCGGLNVEAGAKLSLYANLTPVNMLLDGSAICYADTLQQSGSMVVGTAGVYEHARNGGRLPNATWSDGATLLITGVTSTSNVGGNPGQSYYDIVWNCPGQTTNTNMGMHPTAGGDTTTTIRGDVTVLNTGANRMYFCGPPAGTAEDRTVARIDFLGDIYVSGTAQFSPHGTSSAYTDIIINHTGNIDVTGGNFSISRGSQGGGTGTTTWNLNAGDFSITNATTQNSNSTGAKFVIAGSSPQTLDFTDMTFNGTVPIDVNDGATANVTLSNIAYSSGGPQFTGYDGSTINMGTSVLYGSSRPFTLNSGATLGCGHADGLDSTLSTSGTITLDPAANYTYNGSVAQVTGLLLPANVGDLTIDNGSGVTLSANTTVDGTLFLVNGNVNTDVNTLAISATGSTDRTSGHVVGTFQKNVATGSGVARTFEIGDASNYSPIDLTFANVSTAGDLTATTTATEHPQVASSSLDASKSVNRYFTLTNSGVVFDQYSATFNFVSGDVDGGANPSNFIVERYDGISWSGLTEGTRTATSTQVTGATSLSDFAIGEELIGAFTIDASAGPNGTITPSGSVVVLAGEDTTFTFTPDGCYQVDSVFVDGGYIGAPPSYTFTNVADNHTIHVTFALIQYSITVTQGANGTIAPGTTSVLCGGDQAFAITPDVGYHVDSVFVDGAYVPDSTTSYTFTNVTANHTLTAKYAINTYALTINVVGNGTVARDPDLIVYEHGTSVDIEAIPDDLSWEFKEWSGDLTGSTNPASIVMDGPKTITVTFEQNPAYLTAYRSFVVDSIAFDTDKKGKSGKYEKRKPDKVDFEFFVVNPYILTSPGLHVEFSLAIDDVNFEFGTIPASVASNPDGKKKKWDFTFPTLNTGDTVWVYGYGTKGKPQKVSKYYWTEGGALTGEKLKIVTYTRNVPKMPMPNRINALYETFFYGGYGTNGMVVGQIRTDSNKYFAWFQTLKYKDVWKSFNKKGVLHSGAPHGFDFYVNGKPMKKQNKKLEPTKHNNLLFANLAALQFNITSSAMGITPVGFGEIIYDEPSTDGPFDGMMIKDIAAYADVIMMGWLVDTVDSRGKPAKDHQFMNPTDPGSFNDLDYAVGRINSAFEGELDTVKFSDSLKFTGTRALLEINYLRANTSVMPTIITPMANVIPQEPAGYSLYQNYPNPFNPLTTIEFDLPAEAFVSLKVYNTLGQEVATLLDNEWMSDGTQEVQFDAHNFASGVYFYRIVAEGLDDDGNLDNTVFHQVMKMILIK